MANSRICSIPDCDKPGRTPGSKYCHMHYHRIRRHGCPSYEGNRPNYGLAKQFFNQVVLPYRGSDCLIWPFLRNENGYAVISKGSKPTRVHRLACIDVHGAPPAPHFVVAHNCGNGHLGCVNPQHLRWATRTENQQDMVEHGRSNRGSRNPVAKLSENDVLKIREMAKTMTQKDIAKVFGVVRQTVSDVLRMRRWGWLD